jgi:hypothetical protein
MLFNDIPVTSEKLTEFYFDFCHFFMHKYYVPKNYLFTKFQECTEMIIVFTSCKKEQLHNLIFVKAL